VNGRLLMAVMELIQQRKSVRKYQERPVEREKVVQCIEAARLAPSAENVQPWRFIVLDDPELKKRFCREVCSGIYRPSLFIQNAPVVVVILAHLDFIANVLGKSIQGTNYYLLDIGIAGEHLVLQAQEFGIGTCWIGWFNAKKAKRFLNIPPLLKVVSLMAMGYPAEGGTKNKPDHQLEKVLFFNDEPRKGV
jgi:nitroreductase